MSIGVWQIVLILVIVLIIFGAGKLPHVMGDLAKGIKNFKAGMAEPDKDDDATPAEKKTIEGTSSQSSTTTSDQETRKS